MAKNSSILWGIRACKTGDSIKYRPVYSDEKEGYKVAQSANFLSFHQCKSNIATPYHTAAVLMPNSGPDPKKSHGHSTLHSHASSD
jgi:hypothetical protein